MKSPRLNHLSTFILVLTGTLSPFAAAQSASDSVDPTDASSIDLALSGTLSGEMDQKHRGRKLGKASTSEFTAKLSHPLAERLKVGFTYQAQSIDVEGSSPALALPDELRSISVGFDYVHPLNESWTGVGMLEVGSRTAGGGGDFDSDGLGVSLALVASHQHRPGLTSTWGVAFDSLASNNYRVLPIVGVEWTPRADWTIAFGFPRTAVTYQVTKSFSTSLVLDGMGGSYYVQDDPLPNATGKPALRDTKLEFYEIRTGLRASYAWSKHASLTATAGLVLERVFNYYDRDYRLKSGGTAPYASLAADFAF